MISQNRLNRLTVKVAVLWLDFQSEGRWFEPGLQGAIWDLSFGGEEEGHELPWGGGGGSGEYVPPEIFLK